MNYQAITEIPDSNTIFHDTIFMRNNKHVSEQWIRIGELYPNGAKESLLPETFAREQFGQGSHYECFMLSALATLVKFPDIIRNCFVSRNVRRDGRYTFQFFRDKEWVKVEIDDSVMLEDDEVLFIRSPTSHWWPLLFEKAYAKFYTSYDNLEGCTLQEAYHDLTGNPVLNIPMDARLAKAAGVDVTGGQYWLDLAQKLQSGQFVGSLLTREADLESMGLQSEQQYGILEIFSLTGTSSVSDIVIHLYNPFEDEEFTYKGPLNSKDTEWTPKLREKYNVDDTHSIFLPLHVALKIVNSVQLCYISPIDGDATYFDDEWKGETAGGNPTSVTWRKNPLYCVRNAGINPVELVVVIKQKDQRRYMSPEERTMYLQCGIVVVQSTTVTQIPTYFVTGNNHKAIHKSLFLNSREVSSFVRIPPNSLCYLVPSCMKKGAESAFTLALYRVKLQDYSNILIKKLEVPSMDWGHCAIGKVTLETKVKERVDFFVDCPTDIHILMHQEKPFVNKVGGDITTRDYVGVYLYDDTDRKIGGVHAATNFRETSVLHRLPRSGRYAISITCPRASGEVPIALTIVGSPDANVRIVEAPDDASMFDDEDDIAEGDEDATVSNPIDYIPVAGGGQVFTEVPDSTVPFEDKRFMVDNKIMTNEPWIHIGDLYPEGKTRSLLPERLSREQFEQGEHFECCCLTAFAALVEHHPNVIRDAFVTKAVRRDGRYTFRFHRYGQWVKVEIDDRIPLLGGKTLFCRSSDGYWWPLLLEKAYAKFYTLYQNIEGCTLRELFYDLTGLPVLSIPMELKLAKAVLCDVDDVSFWVELSEGLKDCACAAVARPGFDDTLGLSNGQEYAVLDVVSLTDGEASSISDLVVKLHNPFLETEYKGPMNASDAAWSSELRTRLCPERRDTIYIPVEVFCNAFLTVEKVMVRGLIVPGWQFNSEWGEGTNGGNPTLVTWRENPIYVVQNTADTPLQIIAMIGQPDQRRVLHLLPEQEVNYVQCGLVLSQCTCSNPVPTYLVTSNNHRVVHKGLFVNFRESANIVTIPANSMSYLIPSAMFRDKTKFLLSYWFQKLPDMKFIKISRINVSVARSLPAIEHLELHNHEKKRVDFLVDVPTDIHILLRQEKPCVTVRTHDAMADDFLGIYLYNEDEKRIDGVTAATNYREMGLVHRLATAGRYALSITCPRGTGVVPCRVEIVGVEDAKVRITDPPEDAGNLCEVDLRFLGSEAEGVPLEDLPLDSDADLQAILEELRRLHGDIDANAESIAKHERMMSDRVHKMARQLLAKDRSKYLPGYDLQTVNSILDAEPHFVVLERDRYHLKCDPRNATKVRNVERSLLTLANEILEKHDDPDLSFLGAEVEGIPTLDLTLMSDSSFSEMARERMQLKRDPIANASRLAEVEDSMVARANAIAKEMHLRERRYLNPEPEGVPLELLPLNEDEVVSEKEDRLRALNRKEQKDEKLLRSLEDVIADRVHEIARELKVSERDLFLDPTPGGFPVAQLPLDEDDVFHSLEVERLQLRLRQDSLANKTSEIKELESRLNRRACELARVKVEEGRAFLDPEPLGFPLTDLNLDGDSEFVKLESELRKLRWEPRVNSTAMRTVEEDIARVVHRIALRKTCLDRDYLDAEYEGRPVQGLPLNDSKEVLAMETRRRVLINAKADRDEIGVAENMIRDAVREIARALNVGERLDYLEPCPRGVPVEDLPLDMDTEFHELEVHRQRLKCDAKKQDTVIMDVERALNDRAEALAREHLSSDRGYLDPASVGVPLRLLPLDSDSVFQELEIKRALLKKNPQRNGRAISDLEGGLNERAHVLATEMKHAERSKFMDPNPGGIAIEDVPIDNDEVFCDLEIRRFGLCEDRHANIAAIRNLEDAMNERVIELADKMRCEIRMFLDPMPLGVSLDELPLDNNETFVAKEAELHKLRKDLRANGADVALLKSDLNELAKQMAAEMISKDRAFLFPEPEGRLLEELPLDSDKEFRSLEKQLRLLCKESPPEAQKIAAIEELLDGRAHQLAKMKNCAERKDYLDSHPCGVPLDDVPLDNDDEFSMLEVKRAALMRDVVGNKDSIASVEKALNGRAEKLALLKLRSERSFLDPEPHGIPLHCVPLDDDDSFHLLEVERLTLKGLNIRENDHKLVGVENAMRDYVNDLALEVKRKMREDVLDTSPDGLPLSVLPLDNDLPFIELENGYIKAVFDAKDTLKIQDLAGAMRRRSEDIARKLRSDVRLSLEQHPLGFTLDELPVDDSELFLGKERELLELKRDGRYNSPTAIEIMEELNSIILDIAKEQAIREREFLDQEPEGRHITELNLDSDTTFLGLERQRRLLRRIRLLIAVGL
ncbi:calpain [Trypanosoma brucei equiperdum]|uniref:Calpain n=1 Tax=Trypanosoma brucei equiperdum TaxID=630700 RepID=A0A3L6KVP2_9TRYP|nr:calpain [Trypanosoma brucei equiperdum]